MFIIIFGVNMSYLLHKGDISKILARSWMHRLLLLKAYLLLGILRMAIFLIPFRVLARMLKLTAGDNPDMPSPELKEKAEMIAWAIRAAARRTPWQNACLVRGLAGLVLLRGYGIPCTLFLGVAKGSSSPEELEAHAWLRCGGNVITGAEGHERFSVIASFVVASGYRRK